MTSRRWIIAFLIPTLASGMPSSLFTTRNKPHLDGHAISGVVGPVHMISHPPAVSTSQTVSQPASVDQIDEIISSADFLCYNDKTSLVIPDVPCPAENSQKTQVTSQLLNLVLKFHGGEVLVPGVSSVSPPHLHGYNLSDEGSADWMHYNQSDLSIRLQTLLRQFQENRTQLLDHLLEYTSSNNLRNITSLTNLLFDALNSTSVFNMCQNGTGANTTSSELSCDELQSRSETLNYLNSEVQKLIASEEYSSTSAHIETNSTGITSNGSLSNDTNLDAVIDDLLQRLSGTKADSKALTELYTHLLLALNDFKAVVIKLMHKFVTVLLESDFIEISDKLSRSIFDIKVVLGGDDGIEKLGALVSHTPKPESITEILIDKTVSPDLTTNNASSETTTHSFILSDIKAHELGQDHSLFNHSLLLELVKSDMNGTNATLEAVEYFEVILEVAVTLISSLTELSRLLHEGRVAEFDQDEVLENMTAWHSLRSRTKRDISGSDRCQRQGNIINQTNFISLCSSCLHTTVLDNTYYPRYLTEKVCSSGSSSNPAFRDGCLFQPGLLGGRPAGLCKQQEFNVLLLREVPGKCMKVISQGKEIITDQWQSTTHPLRIGCECVVDQNSQFAKYTHFP
ncbi:unnamed protein product [Candidula unifasciata]|uniref:Uncharacterized protein n=1 Tax=Candidula unifasciata TaxID=100452 RepID=A0A8S3Z8V7_9EUPU|nr:unnamed protein product [Candidula unifasciata]